MDRRQVVHRVNEWADWLLRVSDSSPLGYPSHTVEARMMDGTAGVDKRPASSIVDCRQMPKHVADVDRVIRVMNPSLKEWVRYCHLGEGSAADKMNAYCQANDISRTKYKELANKSYAAIEQGLRQLRES